MNYSFSKLLPASLLLLFAAFYMNAQTPKIDSLRERLLRTSNRDDQKKIVMKICEQHFSLSTDSLLKYINLGKTLVENNSTEYYKLENFYCIYLFKSGRSKESIALNDTLMIRTASIKNADQLRIDIITNRCSGLIRDNKNKEAIQQSFILLQAGEKLKDTLTIIKAHILLGWANMEIEHYEEAVRWLNIGYHYSSNPQLLVEVPGLFINLASSYNDINKMDSALYFAELGLKYSRQGENLATMANVLNIRADIYTKQHNYIAAENDMKEALHAREKIGDMLYVMSDMAQLSSFYASTNQTGKGIETAKQGIVLAQKANNITKLIFLNTTLSENYKKAKLMDEYGTTLEMIMQLKDSLYKNNSGDAIAEMETKYELQKKENIIIRQNYQLNRSKYVGIGSSILFVFGLLLVWALYRNYRLTQKRKMESALAEQKLLSYKAVEQAEENERKRIAADLHDNLGSYAAAITANVKYLKDKTGTDDDNILSQLDGNAQSMVTQLGDTIWVLKNEHLPVTKLADRFKSWMLRLMQNYPHIKYHYQENIIEDVEFTPSRILNIFLILKECVNNALKHSNCTELRISFFSDDYWSVTIEDNGKGFDSSNVLKGSGIDNIRNRALECGWDVQWQDAFPSGTRLIIFGTTTK